MLCHVRPSCLSALYTSLNSTHGLCGATTLTSECWVQQGDPLGPLLFCLVLKILVNDICSDPNCANLSFQGWWYLDDGVVAGPSLAVQKVLALIEEKGPPLGLLVNPSKCEVFSLTDVSLFTGELKRSCSPNMDILGVPIEGLSIVPASFQTSVEVLRYCCAN